jgi:hypothetical protein
VALRVRLRIRLGTQVLANAAGIILPSMANDQKDSIPR